MNGDDCAAQPFVGGATQPSESLASIDVINPSNGRRLFAIAVGCDADVERAVASAREAFSDGRWSDAPPSFRRTVLCRFSDAIAKSASELDHLDAGEMGKPISEAFGNATAAARLLRFYAEATDKLTGDVYASDRQSLVAQRWVPRGIVAAVVPWNFPTYVAILKIAPALAAGNCVVLKPSELSSRSALRLAQLAVEAGVPPGVLNVVPGLGQTVGRALALHRDVDMIAFTGSTTVGKIILQYAAQSNMKVAMTECGGKSPHIVFDDGVDLDEASDAIAEMLVTNQGQICSVGSRLLVQKDIENKVVTRVCERIGRITIGDALDPRTTFGPLASETQCDRVAGYVADARRECADVVTGGKRVLQDTGGFYFEPTVLRGVTPGAKVAQEEIFGPVLSVITFHDLDEALQIANSTMYGLGAYIWTADISTGMKVVKGIRSSVRVNAVAGAREGAGYAASSEPAAQSGIGVEGGLAGMQSYMRRQRVWFSHA